MSRSLLTLEQGKRHLLIDLYEGDSSGADPEAGLHDDEVTEKIEEASEAVLAYLKTADFLDSNGDVDLDSDGKPAIPANVRAATKLMLGYLWEHRDEDAEKAYQNANLPQGVVAMLTPLRTPTLA